jgi:hypothetical protein
MGKVVAELVGGGGGWGMQSECAVVRGVDSVEFLRQTHRIYGVAERGDEKKAKALRLSLEELAVGLAHDFVELKAPPTEDTDESTMTESTQSLSRELIVAARGGKCGSACALGAFG